MDRMRRDMWLTWRKMWRVGVIGCIVLLGTLYVFNFSGMAAFIVAQAQEVGTPTQTSAGDTFIPANPTELTSRQINAFPSIEEALTTTGPTPPPGISRGLSLPLSQNAKVLEDVPAYHWQHGCAPTVLGMIFAYWDRHGVEALLPGDPSTQTDEVNEAIASMDHYNNYSLPLDDLGHSANILPDKSEDPLGDEHADNSIADFMKTSQSVHQLRYGWSASRFLEQSVAAYVSSVAHNVAVSSRFLTIEDGFSWDLYKKEIDAGHPLLLIVDTDGDNQTDHAVVGIGYQDDETPVIAVYDTWDTEVHWYEFKKMQIHQDWGIYGALLVNFGKIYQVNSTEDLADKNPGDGKCETQSGVCTLRAALQEANASQGHDLIQIPAGLYHLTLKGEENSGASGDLDIAESVSIYGEGRGATIIDGSELDENIFTMGEEVPVNSGEVNSSSNYSLGGFWVFINGATIQGGKGGINAWGLDQLVLEDCALSDNDGPAVWAHETALTMMYSVVHNNHYPSSVGGIYVHSKKLTLEYSTVSGNSGIVGGIQADGGYFINGTTINDNTASGEIGGAVLSGGGIIQNSTIGANQGYGASVEGNGAVLSSTITANQKGLYYKGNGVLTLENSIISGNQEQDLAAAAGVQFTSQGYNLIGVVQEGVFTPSSGDLLGVNALLGPLQNNGGLTSTYALLFGSPAIDAANPLGCNDGYGNPLLIDQRQLTRPMDGTGQGVARCDIGAFEAQTVPSTPTPTSAVSPTPTPSASVTLTPTATATSAVSPSPTVAITPTPAKCYEALVNGGFEQDEGWYLPVTMYSAAYDINLLKEAAAAYTSDEVHSGNRSMRTGIIDLQKNIYSYSSAWQQVTIPSDAQKAELSFWAYQQALNGIDGYDLQMMIVLNQNKQELKRFLNERSDTKSWKSFTYDLRQFAGQTVWIYFGTYNNGWGGIMGMYVDDASLIICRP